MESSMASLPTHQWPHFFLLNERNIESPLLVEQIAQRNTRNASVWVCTVVVNNNIIKLDNSISSKCAIRSEASARAIIQQTTKYSSAQNWLTLRNGGTMHLSYEQHNGLNIVVMETSTPNHTTQQCRPPEQNRTWSGVKSRKRTSHDAMELCLVE